MDYLSPIQTLQEARKAYQKAVQEYSSALGREVRCRYHARNSPFDSPEAKAVTQAIREVDTAKNAQQTAWNNLCDAKAKVKAKK